MEIFALGGFLVSFFGFATTCVEVSDSGCLPGIDTRLTFTTPDENRERGVLSGININVPIKIIWMNIEIPKENATRRESFLRPW